MLCIYCLPRHSDDSRDQVALNAEIFAQIGFVHFLCSLRNSPLIPPPVQKEVIPLLLIFSIIRILG